MAKLKVGLFFGGRSTEHEVSVLTGIQAYQNIDKTKYEIIPVYISKKGDFYTNPKFLDLKNFKDADSLLLSSTQINIVKGGFLSKGLFNKFTHLDVVLLAFHGSYGEDGSIQGLLDIYQIPYTGLNVTGSAVGMDKVISKALFKELGLSVGKYFALKRNEWNRDSKKLLKEIQQNLKFPMFVKPALIGSSIGVNKAPDEDSLSFAIEVAGTYADKILIEEAFENVIEVNCSALGYEDVIASVCEMPVASSEVLSFADKYQKGGGKGSKGAGMASLTRVIPAPIPDKLSKEIQEATIKVFKALDGCGVARVDYFVDVKAAKFWINEINTIPGSFSFYLWDKTGVSFTKLLDTLIDCALKRAQNQTKTQYTFESGLLSQMAKRSGLKS